MSNCKIEDCLTCGFIKNDDTIISKHNLEEYFTNLDSVLFCEHIGRMLAHALCNKRMDLVAKILAILEKEQEDDKEASANMLLQRLLLI